MYQYYPIDLIGSFLDIFKRDFRGRAKVYFRPNAIKFEEEKAIPRPDLLSYDGLCIGKPYSFLREPWNFKDPFETHGVSLALNPAIVILAFFELTGIFIKSGYKTRMMFCAGGYFHRYPLPGETDSLRIHCMKNASAIALFSTSGFAKEQGKEERNFILPTYIELGYML